MKKLTLIIFCFCLFGCSARISGKPPALNLQPKPLALQSVFVDHKTFAPDKKEIIKIQFQPQRAALATVTITDQYGRLVKILMDKKSIPAKLISAQWDGTDQNGKNVSDGVYYYLIDMADGADTFKYNPYAMTYGIKVNGTGWFDQDHKRIQIQMPQAAKVRIRAGIKEGGPLLATPLDWEGFEAGTFYVPWDGKDAFGFFNVTQHPKYELSLQAYSLSDNAIIVKGGVSDLEENLQRIKIFDTTIPADRQTHALHNPAHCHEPKINLDFPADVKRNPSGIVLAGAKLPVKITIDPKDWQYLENTRYEIMIYIDTVFLFEDEAGFSPFTYSLDTSKLNKGEHIITVNLLSYDSHCGIISKKIIVE
ncbi:MAG: hypothetical protein HQL26_11065 [Candidatus Omnitrophica bacterium]|nr:hypothetical protein [Candidatus Omnitrophota bacterium]